MDKSSKIKGLIRSITGTDRPSFGFRLMEVVSVEGDLCRAKIDNLEIPDIRLSSINGGSRNGLLVTPATGSIILVADLSCGNLRELCAVAYSEIESVRFHQGDTTITADGEKTEVVVGGSYILVNNGKIKLFGGKENKEKNKEEENDKSNGGLVKVKELTSKINALEASLNDLKSVFGTWTPAAQDGGAALKGAITDWASKELTVTQRTDIENPKVTH